MPAPHAALSNERLEFLGDRVLGLIVAEKLHALYPDDAEGALALKFNALARGAACARAAEAAGLAEHIILAQSEARQRRPAQAGHPVRRLRGGDRGALSGWRHGGGARALSNAIGRACSRTSGADMRDAKTRLQEWAQAPRPCAPRRSITLIGREGPDHAPHFVVEAAVEGMAPETGEGGSKREAEQDAAAKLLAQGGGAMTTLAAIAPSSARPMRANPRSTNALVGSKVAIVTPKVQTTRMNVKGVAMTGETQIVFVDTPGIFRPRRRLDRAMVGAAWAGAEDADAILLVVDAADLTANPKSPCRPRHRRHPAKA